MDLLSELEAEYLAVEKSKGAAELRLIFIAAVVALGVVVFALWTGVDKDKLNTISDYAWAVVGVFTLFGISMLAVILSFSIFGLFFDTTYFKGPVFRDLTDHELEGLASVFSMGSAERPELLSEELVGELAAIIKACGAISLEQLAQSLDWGVWEGSSPDLSAPGTQAILKLAHEKR